MPVPWADEPCRLPDITKRAITVGQLRSLRFFLQRLTKTGLLKDRDNKRIHWFEINMYHITDFVIKPLIVYTEDIHKGTGKRYSWVEFVAAEEQNQKIHFVHSWNGRFRDFMACVDALVRDRDLSHECALWICTFANCQFGEDFGTNLTETPFYNSIKRAPDGTVFIVDRDGGSLQRIWCAIEMYITMELKKPLQIYTSGGKVGDAVKSGSLVEALEAYDVQLCEASMPSDRRQILNYLGAGEAHELDGLRKDNDGKLVLVDGWKKELEDEATTDAIRKRLNGSAEYVHEAKLFERHGEKYATFNATIRGFCKTAMIADEESSVFAEVEQVKDRGIKVGQWRTFVKKVKNWANSQDPKTGLTWRTITMDDAANCVKGLVEARSPDRGNPRKLSYTELLGNKTTRPQFMTDEPKQGSFADFASTIEWFFEAMRLKDDSVIWCQLVCVRQHDIPTEFKDWNNVTLPALLSDVDGLISYLPTQRSLIVRCNRMFAWQICFENAKQLYLGCTSGVLSCGNAFPEGGWVFGEFDVEIARIIVDTDWQTAQSVDPKLGPICAERIRRSPGGFNSFAGRLCSVAAGPVLRHLANNGGPEAVNILRRVCRHDAVMLNSGVLSGCLQETAVHVAAGAGNTEVLQTLLDLQANPNAEDHIRETPLHYAALAGRARAAKMLLRFGARAGAESAFAETPLFVARQNPARYLGVETSKVVKLLQAWEAVDEGSIDIAMPALDSKSSWRPPRPERKTRLPAVYSDGRLATGTSGDSRVMSPEGHRSYTDSQATITTAAGPPTANGIEANNHNGKDAHTNGHSHPPAKSCCAVM